MDNMRGLDGNVQQMPLNNMDTGTSNLILNGLNLNLDKPEQSQEVDVVSEQDFRNFMDIHKKQLRADPTVISLTSKIDATDPKSILAFGEESATEISAISDRLLKSIKAVKEEEANELLGNLTKIMKKINVDELKDDNGNGFLTKLFNKAKKSVEELIAKYESIGGEVEGIYITLKRYENEILKEGDNLSLMYKTNIRYFRDLEKYITALELVLEELDNDIIPKYEQLATETSDPLALNNVEVLKDCRRMVEERKYDLLLAENMALQSLPMIQQMQRGNFELIKLIKSSFVVTLPNIKQGIIYAIMAKRQENRAKNMQDLKNFTNELVVNNARNVNRQAVQLAQMSGTGIVDIDKLEESFNIMKNGLKETERVREENRKFREEGEKKLEKMKYESLTKKDIGLENKSSNSLYTDLNKIS